MDQHVTSTAAMQFVRALERRGVEHVFTNAGTDHAPIVEALVVMRERGESTPQFHVVPHENLAISMAQGYYGVSGKPAVVLLHVTVGTANAICGLMNARRSYVPVILIAGRTPSTQEGHIGSRNVPIHWGQDSFDQGGLVREFTKWDNELRAGQSIDALFDRAMSIAMTEPRGPVYLTLPRELLTERDDGTAGPVSPIASAPQPDAAALGRVAEALARADKPVIVTSTLGTHRAARLVLQQIATDYAVPVLQAWPWCLNIESEHSMNLRTKSTGWLAEADVIVAIDADVPWVPRYTKPRPDAKIFAIGSDPTYSMYPYRDFPATELISGAGFAALPLLGMALSECPFDLESLKTRREMLAQLQAGAAREREARLATARAARPLDAAWVAECLNRARPPNSVIVNELCLPFDFLALRDGDHFFGETTAGGLGAGLGMGLGAKLADRSRTVISAVGDGSFMFGNPTPAMLVARALEVPTLTIVSNNNLWFAVRQSTLSIYPDGAAAGSDPMPLTHFGPSPNYADMASAAGACGIRVTEPSELEAAMARAFERTLDGQAVVLEVVSAPGTR